MKQINSSHKVFQSGDFLKDRLAFYFIAQISKFDSALIYSDGENYILCGSTFGFDAWIWTKNSITKDKLNEVKLLIPKYFTDQPLNRFVCKKDVYEHLVSNNYEYLNENDFYEMRSLACDKPKKPKETNGLMKVPDLEQKELLVKYLFDRQEEIREVESINMDQAAKTINKLLDRGQLLVWVNQNNKIVSMADYNITDDMVKIGKVYTPLEERGKGYAANLIYAMTKMVSGNGLKPLLYTDLHHEASNKAYINAGYKQKSLLVNFSCSKK